MRNEATDQQMTLDECRQRAGELFGLDGPMETELLQRAVSDEGLAQKLLVVRRDPAFRDFVLQQFAGSGNYNSELLNGTELAASAARAFARWAQVGFTTVEDDVLAERLAACSGCPHLAAPPDDRRRLLYRLLGSDLRAVCGKCGCPVVSKARRTSESCPDPDPLEPSRTRWKQPING